MRDPEGITLQPAELLYRSEQCKTARYNSSNESHDIPGYNDIELPFGASNGDNIRRLQVAVDGGGSCPWQPNSLKVSFRIADNITLAKGKEVIDTSYIFYFGDYLLARSMLLQWRISMSICLSFANYSGFFIFCRNMYLPAVMQTYNTFRL